MASHHGGCTCPLNMSIGRIHQKKKNSTLPDNTVRLRIQTKSASTQPTAGRINCEKIPGIRVARLYTTTVGCWDFLVSVLRPLSLITMHLTNRTEGKIHLADRRGPPSPMRACVKTQVLFPVLFSVRTSFNPAGFRLSLQLYERRFLCASRGTTKFPFVDRFLGHLGIT